MVTSPPNWARFRDRPGRHVASIAPERPGEVTLPLPVVPCDQCATGTDFDHEWSEVDRDVFGRVTLRRLACMCDLCGRCDAWIVLVDLARD
jgi:hypothetical protein